MKTVRKPKLTEMTEVKKLLDAAAAQGALLRRPIMELYEFARDFHVYVDEAGMGGCAALHIDMADLAEVRSLAVREDLRGSGIGARLLDACLNEARRLEIARVYALTRQPTFFKHHGFEEVDKHTLPHKVFQDCMKCPLFPDCDEVAVICDL
ncbi:MAG TPA: N-acetyltransferase [Candidatus Hydrogenedentes bacterium]|nr:N-acetyltransferase [Candidatus Hydrogenedentota bacterium]